MAQRVGILGMEDGAGVHVDDDGRRHKGVLDRVLASASPAGTPVAASMSESTRRQRAAPRSLAQP